MRICMCSASVLRTSRFAGCPSRHSSNAKANSHAQFTIVNIMLARTNGNERKI